MIALDLGCGSRKRDGYIGFDTAVLPGVDVICDIEKGLPVLDGKVNAVFSNFLFEHIRDLPSLFEELYRVCAPGAVITFIVPYYASIGAFKDPTHKSFFTEETMRYFSDDKWYGSDYGFKANFKVTNIRYIYELPFHYMNRFPTRFLLKHLRRYLINVVHSMEITMEVVKPDFPPEKTGK